MKASSSSNEKFLHPNRLKNPPQMLRIPGKELQVSEWAISKIINKIWVWILVVCVSYASIYYLYIKKIWKITVRCYLFQIWLVVSDLSVLNSNCSKPSDKQISYLQKLQDLKKQTIHLKTIEEDFLNSCFRY